MKGVSLALVGLVTAALAASAEWTLPDPNGGCNDQTLYRALRDELGRSMSELEVEGLEAPYFISYRVDDLDAGAATASFGSLVSSRENDARLLTVEVRVGDYELDNTNFLSLSSLSAGSSRPPGVLTPLTRDDNYQEIRRQVWLATDHAYKAALEELAQKKAALQNKTLAEEIDDFGRVERSAGTSLVERSRERPARERLESLAVELSEVLQRQQGLQTSRTSVVAGGTYTTFMNSEGVTYCTKREGARLVAEARTQAVDGMPLEDRYFTVAESLDALPEIEVLKREVRALGERLVALRDVELLDRYNGPVLFEPQAAAELVTQGFVPLLLAQREPLLGDERLARVLTRAGVKDFKDRIGARVLPRFMAVTDDPDLESHGGDRLLGGYEADDQGTPGESTDLIQRGYLKTLLSSRTPITGVESSTGNGRAGGVMPSNLIVSASERMSDDELVAELLLLVADRGADFGIIVHRMGSADAAAGPGGPRNRREPGMLAPAITASKVYPDGRRVPLRNVELPDFSAAAFKDIIGVGPTDLVYNTPFSPRSGNPLDRLRGGASFGGFGGPPIVSMVVPALLFEEVTLKRPSDEIPSLPVAGHPFFEAGR